MFDIFETPIDLPSESAHSIGLDSSNSFGLNNISNNNAKIFVVSVGGSLLFDKSPNVSFLSKLSSSIKTLRDHGYQFVLVGGGGSIARDYISAVKSLGSNKIMQDLIGMQAAQANAWLLINAIEGTSSKPLNEITQCKDFLNQNKIPVFAGLLPGLTSDTVAVLLAEYLNASFWLPFAKHPPAFEHPHVTRMDAPFAGMT